MKAKSQRGRTSRATKPAKKKSRKKRVPPKLLRVIDRGPSRRSRKRLSAQVERLAMSCFIVGVEPDAEMIILRDSVFHKEFAIPLATPEKDGSAVRHISMKPGQKVWLSLKTQRTLTASPAPVAPVCTPPPGRRTC